MDIDQKLNEPNRRQFLGKVLQLGCLACITPSALSNADPINLPVSAANDESSKHKFQDDSKWSFERAYQYAFQEQLLPNLKAIEDEIGKEKLIEIIKKSNEKRSFEWGKLTASKLIKPSLDEFINWHRKPNWFWNHVISYSVVEDTPKAFECKFTECLWAKTFLDAKNGDLGYAVICHGDFAYAEGYSDKLKLIRTKTLMQGDSYCNHRYVWSE